MEIHTAESLTDDEIRNALGRRHITADLAILAILNDLSDPMRRSWR